MNGELDKQIRIRSRDSELLQRRAWRLGLEIQKDCGRATPIYLLKMESRTDEGKARQNFLIQEAEEKREDVLP